MKITAEHRVKIVQYDDPIVRLELSAKEAVNLLDALEASLLDQSETKGIREGLTQIISRYNIDKN